MSQAVAVLQALTFITAAFCAIVAAQLYLLLKTGEVGKTWRFLIMAVLLFALHSAIGFLQTIGAQYPPILYEGTKFAVILCLAWAFYIQLRIFAYPMLHRTLAPKRNPRLHKKRKPKKGGEK